MNRNESDLTLSWTTATVNIINDQGNGEWRQWAEKSNGKYNKVYHLRLVQLLINLNDLKHHWSNL